MNSPKKNKNEELPPQLITTTWYSGTLTILLSATNMVLSILAIVYRYNCYVAELPYHGADYFLVTVIRTYILQSGCRRALSPDMYEGVSLTKADSIFILAILLLTFSFINMITAVFAISMVSREQPVKNFDISIYVYLGSSLAMFVVDLTLAVHFGIDHETMKEQLGKYSAGYPMNYEPDMIRLGAMLFMSIALKGYFGHLINLVLLALIMYYLIKHQRRTLEDDHPIHTLGMIHAFEKSNGFDDHYSPQRSENLSTFYARAASVNGLNNDDEIRPAPMRETSFIDHQPSPPKQFEDPWVPMYRQDPKPGYPRGGQSNLAFTSTEPRRMNLSLKDSTSERVRDSSPSWLHNSGAARPFSYLEDPKRPLPVKSPSAAVPEPQWRRDPWQAAPPVPDPDYSPPARRLKSALKSNYM